jgi:hypothetical protein
MDVLVSQKATLKTTGPYCDSLGRSLDKQHHALQSFKEALDLKYETVKVRSAESWSQYNSAMASVAEAFPAIPI